MKGLSYIEEARCLKVKDRNIMCWKGNMELSEHAIVSVLAATA